MKNVASLNNLALFIYLTGRQLHCVAIQEFLLYLQYHSHWLQGRFGDFLLKNKLVSWYFFLGWGKTESKAKNIFFKVAWSQSHLIQWKFKLLAGKFTWGNKAKHCWVMWTNFLFLKACWQYPAMFCLYTSSKLSRP